MMILNNVDNKPHTLWLTCRNCIQRRRKIWGFVHLLFSPTYVVHEANVVKTDYAPLKPHATFSISHVFRLKSLDYPFFWRYVLFLNYFYYLKLKLET